MMSNTTHSTPAATARKATTKVAARAGRDTGSTSFLRNTRQALAPSYVKLAESRRDPDSRGGHNECDLHDRARSREPLLSPFRYREPGTLGGLPTYALIVTFVPPHPQHMDRCMTKLSCG